MLVIANGAFKSGSTWLYTILRKTEHFSYIPDRFRDGVLGKGKDWLRRGKVKEFLNSDLYKHEDYLIKGHFFRQSERGIFLAYNDVYCLNIKRDIKDALVSHYYHLIRQGKINESRARPENLRKGFADYYWRLGRFKAYQLRIYHETWDVSSPKIYVSSFERLKTDFDNEVACIGYFLNLPFLPEEITGLKEKTRIDNLQKEQGIDQLAEHKRFFRKGLIGEWKQHFDERMVADVIEIEQQGLKQADLLKYHAIFAMLGVRRAIQNR